MFVSKTYWRCLQDMSSWRLEDVFSKTIFRLRRRRSWRRLRDVLKTNKCLLGLRSSILDFFYLFFSGNTKSFMPDCLINCNHEKNFFFHFYFFSFIYLSNYLFIYLFIHLFIYLFFIAYLMERHYYTPIPLTYWFTYHNNDIFYGQ